jgi:SSS family transporter
MSSSRIVEELCVKHITATTTTTEKHMTSTSLHWIDIAILCLYFLIIFSIGLYFGPLQSLVDKFRSSSSTEKQSNDDNNSNNSTQKFFLADRNVTFFAIGCSLFASNIGSEHFIGLAASGAKEGLCVSWGEWLSPWFILLLGFLFTPFYLRAQVYTLPEFIEKRYNSKCRVLLSITSLFLYMMTKICVSIYAGTIVLKLLWKMDVWLSAIILVVLTGIYTISGGLNAVIYTEVIQTIILICGGVAVFFFSIARVGGWNQLIQQMNLNGGKPISSSFRGYEHLVQPPTHKSFPITGVLFGMPFVSLWYWSTDQVIVQRVLCAKNTNHGIAGCVYAGFLKILPPLVMVIPGMTANVILPQVVKNEPNLAFVSLVIEVLPIGFRGLMYAALLAALMSSLASVFHSASTLFTMDIYRKIRPYILQFIGQRNGNNSDEEEEEHQLCNRYEYVIVGRIAGTLITVLGVLWIPLVPLLSEELYIYTHKVMSYMAPPISIVFLFGVCSKRVNATGAICTLVLGWVIGIGRLVLEVHVMKNGTCSAFTSGSSSLFVTVISFIVCINFLHFSALLSLLCMITIVSVSLATETPSVESIQHITVDWSNLKGYWKLQEEEEEEQGTTNESKSWFNQRYMTVSNLIAAGALIACLIALYISFA